MKSYKLYMFFCWITHPFRWLMPFWKFGGNNEGGRYPNFSFAVWYLFRNDYKRDAVTSFSVHETGVFSSRRCREDNNYFGMGRIKDGTYQDDASSSNGMQGEPSYFAVYKNVYRSVYDYYNYMYERFPSSGQALDSVPTASFDPQSTTTKNYIYAVLSRLKANGYFTGDLVIYGNAVKDYSTLFRVDTWRICVNVVYCILVPCTIAWLYRRHVLHK